MEIGFLQRPATIGGPGSFLMRLERGLKQMGHEVVFLSEPLSRTPDVILVLGGPIKALLQLIRWKKKGVPIVHRLAGFYWRHRVEAVSKKTYLECVLRNRVMQFVRNHLANYVVYQSKFVQQWWHDECSPAQCPETVIYNGVDLAEFFPSRDESDHPPLLLVVEGEIRATVSTIKVLTTLPRLVDQGIVRGIEVYGKIAPEVKKRLEGISGLKLMGPVPREQVPLIFKQRGIYLSIKVNHSCPNIVLEALASGMPVVGFDTGALPELVSPDAGCIVPYGANPWLEESPDIEGLYRAIEKVAQRLDDYRAAARALAERRFSLETMTMAYVTVFQNVVRN